MLHTLAKTSGKQKASKYKGRGCPTIHSHGNAGNQRAGEQQPHGPDTSAQIAARHLEQGEGTGEDHLEQTHLRKAHGELSLPERKKDIQHVGKTIVYEMGQPARHEGPLIFKYPLDIPAQRRCFDSAQPVPPNQT
jgi:hypothetical protein